MSIRILSIQIYRNICLIVEITSKCGGLTWFSKTKLQKFHVTCWHRTSKNSCKVCRLVLDNTVVLFLQPPHLHHSYPMGLSPSHDNSQSFWRLLWPCNWHGSLKTDEIRKDSHSTRSPTQIKHFLATSPRAPRSGLLLSIHLD